MDLHNVLKMEQQKGVLGGEIIALNYHDADAVARTARRVEELGMVRLGRSGSTELTKVLALRPQTPQFLLD